MGELICEVSEGGQLGSHTDFPAAPLPWLHIPGGSFLAPPETLSIIQYTDYVKEPDGNR